MTILGSLAVMTTKSILVFLFAFFLSLPVWAEHCKQPVASLESLEGSVSAKSPSGSWIPAKQGHHFCQGDSIRVGQYSRAGLVLANNTLVRLDQNSTLTLSEFENPEATWIELVEGVSHFISRIKRSFKVNTPFVNAAVEGTEFIVRANQDLSQVSVFEGQVLASNDSGELRLSAGQTANIINRDAPSLALNIKPDDLVQWSIYIPPVFDQQMLNQVIFHLAEKQASDLRAAIIAYENRQYDSAIDLLNNVGDLRSNYLLISFRAVLYLSAGRFNAARNDIAILKTLDNNQSATLVLQSLFALSSNQNATALTQARKAYELLPNAFTALNLSYALQANRQLVAALQILKDLREIDQTSISYARMSELLLSFGNDSAAIESAKKAIEKDQNASLAHMVLGFAYISALEIEKAKASLETALKIDQANPMIRLGLGLVTIRLGELAVGRRQIELAVNLDPLKAISRSYLGKAYYEEARFELASTQYDLAKQLDPNDPTPWFYNAVLLRDKNSPSDTLHELQESISKNDNRMIYRSRLLLDNDNAARSVNLAHVYTDLGMDQLAISEASQSIIEDPSNFAAHRFLADSYSGKPRFENARASELYQAQMLQPINASPMQTWIDSSHLGIVNSTGSMNIGYNEFSNLFERTSAHFELNSQAMGDNTRINSLSVRGNAEKTAVNMSIFNYSSDGFRENSDQEQSIKNFFIQSQLVNNFAVQVEYNDKAFEGGDIAQRFGSDNALQDMRVTYSGNQQRIGFTFRKNSFIALYNKNTFSAKGINQTKFFGMDFVVTNDAKGKTDEIKLIHSIANNKIQFGLIQYEDNLNPSVTLSGAPFPGDLPSSNNTRTAYLYTDFPVFNQAVVSPGITNIEYKVNSANINKLNPSLSISLSPSHYFDFNVVAFEKLSQPFFLQQSLIPTNIGLFSQHIDDGESTFSRNYGALLSLKTRSVFSTLRLLTRSLSSNLYTINESSVDVSKENKKQDIADFSIANTYKNFHTAFNTSVTYFRRDYDKTKTDNERPPFVNTIESTLNLKYNFRRYYLTTHLSHVNQHISFINGDNETLRDDKSIFMIANFGAGMYLLKKKVYLAAQVLNLTDKAFDYHGVNPDTTQVYNLKYYPHRLYQINLRILL